jgi:hypothetical protein
MWQIAKDDNRVHVKSADDDTQISVIYPAIVDLNNSFFVNQRYVLLSYNFAGSSSISYEPSLPARAQRRCENPLF